MITLVAASTQQYTIKNLAVYFDRVSDISLIFYAKDGVKAIEIVDKYQPNVIIMNLEIPVINGIEATNVITQRFPNTKIILQIKQDDLSILNFALTAGAKGIILNTTSFKDIEKIIPLVTKGFYQIESILSECNQDKCIAISLNNENNSLAKIINDIDDLKQSIASNQEKTIITVPEKSNSNNKYSYKKKTRPNRYEYRPKYLINLSYLGNDSFFITGFVFGVLCCAIAFYFLLSFSP